MKNCEKLKKRWIINCKKLEEPEFPSVTKYGIEFMFYIKRLTIILTYDIMIVVERGYEYENNFKHCMSNC
jgi:hypothetical protein